MARKHRDEGDRHASDEGGAGRTRGGSAEGQLAASASALLFAARVVKWVAWLFAGVIALGTLFAVLDANPHNGIASTIHGLAVTLVAPFKNLFHPGDAKLTVAVNWGVALVFYLLVGWLIARVLRAVAARVAVTE
ncbi:MAG TPA: hypothetical protein VKA96_02470 [Solirubrobacteraceae bacterium]|nr:hypothetical protein [Solirubrobacteraceae bacterium]